VGSERKKRESRGRCMGGERGKGGEREREGEGGGKGEPTTLETLFLISVTLSDAIHTKHYAGRREEGEEERMGGERGG
jgi:hypothetical protein